MTIQQLEYITALDTYRHYVTAAEKCFVTQPTITLQVKKLEDEVGIQIFDRSKTPLKPTPMGKLIIAKARNVIMEMDQLKEMVNGERENLKGTFKIGVIPTVSPYLIPQFLGGFMQKYPDTHLDIEEMRSEEITEAIKKNKIDIGILVTPINENSIREISLYNEPFLYYGTDVENKNSVSQKEIENTKGLWLLSSGHCFGKQVLNICNYREKENKVHFRSGSIETLMKMVDEYGGFTLIPELVSLQTNSANTLSFTDPQPIREVSIVVHKGFVKESLINAIRKEILAIVPDSFIKNKHFTKVKWR